MAAEDSRDTANDSDSLLELETQLETQSASVTHRRSAEKINLD